MGWQCKLCKFVASSKGELLKHYRLKHGHFGRGNVLPCIHLNCPCSFKTWSALRSHLYRAHNSEDTQSPQNAFKCKICDSCFQNTKNYFQHINSHLKRLETIECVFEGCEFQTNIYGTYATHKSRKHPSYACNDFKAEVIVKCLSNSVEQNELPVLESVGELDSTVGLDSEESEDDTGVLEKLIGSLFLKLESVYNVSGKCIDDLVEQLQFICTSSSQYIPNLVRDILTQNNCTVDETVISELVEKLCRCNPLSKAFGADGPFVSKFKRAKYFKENFRIVEPVEYILDPVVNCTFQYIPILQSLQQLLNDKDIASWILTRHSSTASQLSSFHDGEYYKSNEFHANGELRISLILYVDDFEICNPLGTSRKKHKVTAVYWVIADVPSELRSQLTSINLALLCKANDIKKFGYDTVLEPLLNDLITLEKEGIFFPTVGKNIRGTVFCVSADNLGAHSLSGLVESFTGHYICRFCIGDKSDYQQKKVHSGAFPPRTKENYALHIQTVKENPALLHNYGVKKGCPLTDKLKYFHFVTGYPPDVLHDLFEGIIPLEVALCLNVFIKKRYFTLIKLNELITQFPYKGTDKIDHPQPIPLHFASCKSIGGNAAENWTLLRLLPFIIGVKIPFDEPAWQVLMTLKDITELVVSPIQTEESISYLDTLISEHRDRLLEVFPEQKLIPKHHFLEHYPAMIKCFGPLVCVWTMRFEAKHSFFKRVVKYTHTFRNVLLSLASKHQLMMAYDLHSVAKPVLSVSKVSSIPLALLHVEIQDSFKEAYPTQTTVNLTNAVSYHGTKYAIGMILPYGSTSGLPDFVEISQIVIVGSDLNFIVMLLNGWYHEHFRGYVVENSGKMTLLQIKQLSDTYPLAAYCVGGNRMVTLKRHIISQC